MYDLPVIGDKIVGKLKNVIRFYFENFNSIRSGIKGVETGKFFGKLMNKMEVDYFGKLQTIICNGK